MLWTITMPSSISNALFLFSLPFFLSLHCSVSIRPTYSSRVPSWKITVLLNDISSSKRYRYIIMHTIYTDFIVWLSFNFSLGRLCPSPSFSLFASCFSPFFFFVSSTSRQSLLFCFSIPYGVYHLFHWFHLFTCYTRGTHALPINSILPAWCGMNNVSWPWMILLLYAKKRNRMRESSEEAHCKRIWLSDMVSTICNFSIQSLSSFKFLKGEGLRS